MIIPNELKLAVKSYLFHVAARPIVTKKAHQIKKSVLESGEYLFDAEWSPEYEGRVTDFSVDWMMDQKSFDRYLIAVHTAYLAAGFEVEFDRSPESMIDNDLVESMKSMIDAASDLLSEHVGAKITRESFRITPQLLDSYANTIVDLVVSECRFDKAAIMSQALAGKYAGFPLS